MRRRKGESTGGKGRERKNEGERGRQQRGAK